MKYFVRLLYVCCLLFGAVPSVWSDVPVGTGTAFVVNADGYLLTCAHVVDGATSVKMLLKGKAYAVSVVDTDRPHDLALLQAKTTDLIPLPLGDSAAMARGAKVYVAGYPLADELGTNLKITRGTLSGLVKSDELGALLQIDAPINFGNSGGPLMNDRGEVIGVVNAKIVGAKDANMAFAVPVNTAKALLRAHGIDFTPPDPDAPAGRVLIKQVVPSVALVVTFGEAATSPTASSKPPTDLLPRPVCLKKKWGYINANGEFVIPPAFDCALPFADGLASVMVEGKWGFIDATGQFAIPPTYDLAYSFTGGLSLTNTGGTLASESEMAAGTLMKGGHWRFIRRDGETVLAPRFEVVYPFSQGYALVQSGGKYGFINTDGKLVVDTIYDGALPFSQGLAAVEHDGRWGYINTTGAYAITPRYSAALEFAEGKAAVQSDGAWGFINSAGRQVVALRFPLVGSYAGGLALVDINGKIGYLNSAGQLAIAPRFLEGAGFSEGMAIVRIGKKYGFINKAGAVAVEPRYNHVGPFLGGLAPVRFGKKWGFVNTRGDLIIDLYFDDVCL